MARSSRPSARASSPTAECAHAGSPLMRTPVRAAHPSVAAGTRHRHVVLPGTQAYEASAAPTRSTLARPELRATRPMQVRATRRPRHRGRSGAPWRKRRSRRHRPQGPARPACGTCACARAEPAAGGEPASRPAGHANPGRRGDASSGDHPNRCRVAAADTYSSGETTSGGTRREDGENRYQARSLPSNPVAVIVRVMIRTSQTFQNVVVPRGSEEAGRGQGMQI